MAQRPSVVQHSKASGSSSGMWSLRLSLDGSCFSSQKSTLITNLLYRLKAISATLYCEDLPSMTVVQFWFRSTYQRESMGQCVVWAKV